MRQLVLALALVACSKAPAPPVAPRVAPAAELTFRGRIRVAEDDPRPVANARVRWMVDRRPARTAEAALRLVGEGTTDADGRFALPHPPPDAEGYASVWCERADGWALIAAGLQSPTQDILRDRGGDFVPWPRDSFVRMRVTGGGEPLPGARVELLVVDDGAPVPGDMHPVTTTDDRGLVEIHGLEGSEYWADISADGFAPVRMATHQFYGDDDVSVDEHDLPRAKTLHCRITGTGDVRPMDAVVRVKYDSGRGGTEWFLSVGESGEIDIPVPRDGEVELCAEAPGFAQTSVSGGNLAAVVLRLPRLRSPRPEDASLVVDGTCGGGGGPVPQIAAEAGIGNGYRGRVRGAGADAAPPAGARVRWVFDRRPARTAELALRRVEEATVAADGTFTLPMPAADAGQVSLWCEMPDGWHLLGAGLTFKAAQAYDWEQGDFRIPARDHLVRVSVADVRGAPVAGARVELVLDADGAPVGGPASATADAGGIAEIRNLEPALCWADVSAAGFAPTRVSVPLAPASGPFTTTVTIERARPLRCRIVAPGGALPPGTAAEVTYGAPDASPGHWFLPVCRDGSFVAAVPVDGEVSLCVLAPGFRDATLDASADVEEFVVDLVPSPK